MEKIKKYWWLVLIIVVMSAAGFGTWRWFGSEEKQVVLSPEAPWIVVEKPLEKYSFENLRQKVWIGSEVTIEDDVFFYKADGKKISGQIHVPKGNPPAGGWPVAVMIRGYVDKEMYRTGIGTERVAEVLAENGFITLAPDFLGFGQSDMPPNNSIEERFMRPGQILELISSVKNIDLADEERISIWGHSNGGQIALSVLEISGREYPTSLWAPVSKPFPYSILYYTDEFDDHGRALRKVVAGFEALYEADDYSIDKYYDWIKAPVQIHQGTNDDAVPLEWSKQLEEDLKKLDKKVELFVYSGADHNLAGSWNEAVARTVDFFR